MLSVNCKVNTTSNVNGLCIKILALTISCLFLIARPDHSFADKKSKTAPQVQTGEYRLSGQDKVRVRVYEWRVGGYEEWKALSGEFVVDVTGSVFLPLVGRVPVKNMTVVQLANQVASRLKERAGLNTLPDVSIEIVEYRPVYILGAIQNPGEYPYRPGLTTMRAMAIAGGLFREPAVASGGQNLQRIRSRGRLQQAYMKLRRAYIRRARLNTEREWIEAKKTALPILSLPVEVKESKQNNQLLNDEVGIMNARLAGLRGKTKHLIELSKLFSNEKRIIDKNLKIQKKRVELASIGEARAEKLKKKRILHFNRWMQAKRLALQSQNSELDVSSTRLRLILEQKRGEREINDERFRLLELVTTDLLEVKSRIGLLQSGIAEEKLYLGSVVLPDSDLGTEKQWLQRPIIEYTIKRVNDSTNQLETLTASENTTMRPGDIVQIELGVGDGLDRKAVGKPALTQ